MSSEYKQQLDGMLRAAELSLAGRGAMIPLKESYAPVHSRHAALTDTSPLIIEELSRQVRVCMKEIVELRSELAAEKVCRSELHQALLRRTKEDVLSEVRAVQFELQKDLRELDGSVNQRIQESASHSEIDRRRYDDIVRMLKSQERVRFDIAEQYRESLDDLRARVDAAVAGSTSTRAEIVQQLDNDRALMQRRLEVELSKYAEMHRQHQQSLQETRTAVTREAHEIGKTVKMLVEQSWEDRSKALQKITSDKLQAFKDTQDKHTGMMAELEAHVNTAVTQSRRDLAAATVDIRDRTVALEGAMPLLVARADRIERKSDAVVESNSKLSAQVDLLREAADKATAAAARSMERAQKVEDTVKDRDARILSLESQCIALAGLDGMRSDLDGAKRSVQRVEGQIESIREIADRSERLVEGMQRSIDMQLERGDEVEKRSHKLMARVDASEQRMTGLLERIVRIEDATDRNSTHIDSSVSTYETLVQRAESLEHRLALQAEKADVAAKDWRERMYTLEHRVDLAEDFVHRSDQSVAATRRALEKYDKHIAKLESGAMNSTENVRELKESLDALSAEITQNARKGDSVRNSFERLESLLQDKHSEMDSAVTSLQESIRRLDGRASGSIAAAERRLTESVEALTIRVDDLSMRMANTSGSAAARALTTHLDQDVAHLRLRCNSLDARVGALESLPQLPAQFEVKPQQQQITKVVHVVPTVTETVPVEPVPSRVPAVREEQRPQPVVAYKTGIVAPSKSTESTEGRSEGTSYVSSAHRFPGSASQLKPSEINFDSDEPEEAPQALATAAEKPITSPETTKIVPEIVKTPTPKAESAKPPMTQRIEAKTVPPLPATAAKGLRSEFRSLLDSRKKTPYSDTSEGSDREAVAKAVGPAQPAAPAQPSQQQTQQPIQQQSDPAPVNTTAATFGTPRSFRDSRRDTTVPTADVIPRVAPTQKNPFTDDSPTASDEASPGDHRRAIRERLGGANPFEKMMEASPQSAKKAPPSQPGNLSSPVPKGTKPTLEPASSSSDVPMPVQSRSAKKFASGGETSSAVEEARSMNISTEEKQKVPRKRSISPKHGRQRIYTDFDDDDDDTTSEEEEGIAVASKGSGRSKGSRSSHSSRPRAGGSGVTDLTLTGVELSKSGTGKPANEPGEIGDDDLVVALEAMESKKPGRRQ